MYPNFTLKGPGNSKDWNHTSVKQKLKYNRKPKYLLVRNNLLYVLRCCEQRNQVMVSDRSPKSKLILNYSPHEHTPYGAAMDE